MEYLLVLWWLVAYLGLLAVGIPVAGALFPRFADRGAGVALPLVLAVLWVVVYLVGHVSVTLGMYAGLAILFVAAGVATYRGVPFDRRRYAEVAAVFTAAFLFMVAIRAVDAGVHPGGGEKFLDFGLLRSTLRADVVPPEDMWFAGRPVNYYYGGHLVAAVLTKITGSEPRYAYNLALAGFYSLFVTAAYGLAGSVAASRGVSRVRAGVFGAFFVGFAANLATLGGTLSNGLGHLLDQPGGFNYWPASRVIDGTINEFPLFAWLNGDLHAHMTVQPFVLLIVAVCFAYYRAPASSLWRRRLLVFGGVPPLAGMLAVTNTWSFPTAGGLTFLTLALAPADPVSLFTGEVREGLGGDAGGAGSGDRWSDARTREIARHGAALVGAVGVVALAALVWSLPFWLGMDSTRSVEFWPDRSPMSDLLVVHGAFVVVFGLHLVRHALPVLDADHVDELLVVLAVGVVLAWSGVSAAALALFGPMVVVAWILLRTQATAVAGVTDRAADAVGAAVSDGGASVRGEAADRSGAGSASETASGASRLRDLLGYETVLFVAGAGLVVLVEFVYLKNQAAPGRFNTVFKAYADVWALWAVGAGAALAHLVDNHSPSLALSGDRWKTGLRLLAAALVVSTSLYGVFAVEAHFNPERAGVYGHPEDPTLDGFRFVEERHPAEYEAVLWFEDLEGQPNIVEAPGDFGAPPNYGAYRWTNPISSLTGIPTLAGWSHEADYQGENVYDARVEDVNAIYAGPPGQRAFLLDAYDVEYVYVGDHETRRYTDEELAVFEEMAGVRLVEQWQEGFQTVRVYRVDRDALVIPEE